MNYIWTWTLGFRVIIYDDKPWSPFGGLFNLINSRLVCQRKKQREREREAATKRK